METLVTVGVVVVVAGLLLVVIDRVKQQGNVVAASANVRQIGLALANYVLDHEGSLPGPATVAVYRFGREEPEPEDSSHLGAYLAPYLGVKGYSDNIKALICPGMNSSAMQGKRVPHFIKVDYPEESPDNRFGSWRRYFTGEPAYPPKKMAALTDVARRTPILTTADKKSWVTPSNTLLPEEGVFEGKRIWLFLDGSQELNAKPPGRWVR